MSALTEAMRRNGILRPDEVVELARDAGLELAAACVLLVKESGGGRNVWGHDPVPTGGAYAKGSPVTPDNYAAYRRALAEGRAGRQGVGPCQLTAADYQDAADRLGGCWDWRTNVFVGFRTLAGHQRRYGERGGFVAYNGGPGALTRSATHPAQLYGDDAMRKLAAWRSLLPSSPAPQEDDMPLTDADVERVALRAAELVWTRPTRNAKGEFPSAEGILAAAEGRAWDVQDRVYDLLARPVPGALSDADLNALAERVVNLLAYKLAGGKA